MFLLIIALLFWGNKQLISPQEAFAINNNAKSSAIIFMDDFESGAISTPWITNESGLAVVEIDNKGTFVYMPLVIW